MSLSNDNIRRRIELLIPKSIRDYNADKFIQAILLAGSIGGSTGVGTGLITWEDIQNIPGNIVFGAGTLGYLPKFTAESALGDSIVREEDGSIIVNGPIYASNFIKSGTGGGSDPGGGGGSEIVTWENITGKPENFPTTWDLVANKPATATRWPTWNEVTDKPTIPTMTGTIGAIPKFSGTSSLTDSIMREDSGQIIIEGDLVVNGYSFSNNFIKNGSGGSGGSGGTGTVTWENILDKPLNFPTTWDLVAGKPATATRWPTWAEVTDKPTTFTPSAHTLESHSDVSITTPTNVQYLGWNGTTWINRTVSWNELADKPTIPTVSGTIGRIPKFTSATGIGDSIMYEDGTQIFIEGDLVVNGYSFAQNFIKDGTGGSGGSGGTGTVTWENILNKPLNFPTTWDLVAGKPATATRWPTWSEVTNKPATFTPSAHTHPISDIISLESSLEARVIRTASNGEVDYNGSFNRFIRSSTAHPVFGVYGTGINFQYGGTTGSSARSAQFWIGNIASSSGLTAYIASTWDGSAIGPFELLHTGNSRTDVQNDSRYLLNGANSDQILNSSNTDLNNMWTGAVYAATSATNKPVNQNSHILSLRFNSSFGFQLSGRSGQSYVRYLESGTWGSWSQLWHSGNNRSNAENDAQYVLKAGDTMTGQLRIGSSLVPASSGILLSAVGASGSYIQTTKTNSVAGGAVFGFDGSGVYIGKHTGTVGSESYTRHITITSSGNIGIDTSGPEKTFDVNGRVRGRDAGDFYRGITGAYNDGVAASTNWASPIWSLGAEYNGTGTASSFVPSVGHYGMVWVREGHSLHVSGLGEGVQFFRGSNSPYAIFGRLGSRFYTTVQATNFIKSSDLRLKSDFRPITNWRQAIDQVRGLSYIKDGTREMGFIAQEVEKVLPDLVKADHKGFLSMDYNGMIPVLWEAMKEEITETEKLKNRVSELEKEVERLKSAA
jgi:hypothetical protein